MTNRAEGFLDRRGDGFGGGGGSTNLGRLTGLLKLCLRSFLPSAMSEADLDLSRLLPVGRRVVLEGRDECCGVPGGMGPGVAGGDGDSSREEWA